MNRDDKVSLTCVSPGTISPDDLMAYVDRRASPTVVAHVESCPACAAEARSYARFDRALRRKLYRFDCPPPQTLGDYQLDLLDPTERQVVAAHLIECPNCVDELRALRGFLADELPVAAPSVLESTVRSLRRVVATLVSPTPGLAYAGLRGSAGTSQSFRAGGVALTVGLGAPDRRGRSSISGLLAFDDDAVSGPSAPEVRLLVHDELTNRLVQATVVDELGNFDLDGVAPGTYTLEIDVGDRTIVVEDLAVEA